MRWIVPKTLPLAVPLLCLLLLGGCESMGELPFLSPFTAAMPTGEGAPRQAAEPGGVDATASRHIYLDVIAGLQSQGLHRAALAYLDEYDGKHPKDERASLLRAKSLSALGLNEDAERLYWTLTKTAFAPAAYNGLGTVAAREGRWRAAEQEFRRAVELRPTNTSYLNNLGHALLRQNRLDQAEFLLLQALELRRGEPSAQANLILCRWLKGRVAEAEGALATLPEGERARVRAYLTQYVHDRNGGLAASPVEQSAVAVEGGRRVGG